MFLVEGGNRFHACTAVGLGERHRHPPDSHSSPLIGDRIIDVFCENLQRYVVEEPLLNVCDPNRGC